MYKLNPALAFVLSFFLTLLLPYAALGIIVIPADSLVNIPFKATITSVPEGTTLFLSTAPSCVTPGISPCTLTGNEGSSSSSTSGDSFECTFKVTDADVGLNISSFEEEVDLFWCTDASQNPISSVKLYRISMSPHYYIQAQTTKVTFNKYTPIGTQIVVPDGVQCNGQAAGSPCQIGSSRTLDILVTNRMVVTFDAIVNQARYEAVLMVGSGNFLYNSSDGTQSIRYRVAEFTDESGGTNFALTSTAECRNVVAGPFPVASDILLDMPAGLYYYCALKTARTSLGIFTVMVPPQYPKFTLGEYGLEPHTMYADRNTYVTLTRDASRPSNFEAGLFLNSDCTTSIVSWRLPSRPWNVPATGNYFACARQPSKSWTVARAAAVHVITSPTVAISPSTAIAGMPIVATITRPPELKGASLLFGLSYDSRCMGQSILSMVTTSTSIPALLPENVTGSIYVCLSSPFDSQNNLNQGVITNYVMSTLSYRNYDLSYPALFAGRSYTLTLDPQILPGGTKVKVLPKDKGCASTVDFNIFTLSDEATQIPGVSFPTATDYLFCSKLPQYSTLGYLPLATLSVSEIATVTPNAIIPQLSNTVIVAPLSDGIIACVVTAPNGCTEDNIANNVTCSAASGGQASLNLNYAGTSNLQVCVGYQSVYQGLPGPINYVLVGTIQTETPTIAPTFLFESVDSLISIEIPDSSLLTNTTIFLLPNSGSNSGSQTVSCPAQVPTSAISASVVSAATEDTYSYAVFTSNQMATKGSYFACIGSNANGFFGAGLLSVVDPISVVSLNNAKATIGLPVSLKLQGLTAVISTFASFVIADSSTSCASALAPSPSYAQGMIDKGELSPFIIQATAPQVYRVCVGFQLPSTPLTVYAQGGDFYAYQFTALTTVVPSGVSYSLMGWPMLPAATLTLGTCNSGNTPQQCSCSPSNQVPAPSQDQSVPVGLYVMCQNVGTPISGIATSNNTVNVVGPWLLQLQSPLPDPNVYRLNKVINVVLQGGDVDLPRSEPYELLFQPESFPCGSIADASMTDRFVITNQPSSGVIQTSVTLVNASSFQSVNVCLKIAPGRYITPQMAANPIQILPYMTPYTITADVQTTVRNNQWKDGVTITLSTKTDCSDSVIGSSGVSLTNGLSSLLIKGCDNGNQKLFTDTLYYCEKSIQGVYTNRGAMGFLRKSSCPNKGDAKATISPISSDPGAPITDIGTTSSYLDLSTTILTTGTCADGGSSPSNGLYPPYNIQSPYFVCIKPVGVDLDPPIDSQGKWFTTTTASVTVPNWKVTPTSVSSQPTNHYLNAISTQMFINYQTWNPQQTFFSDSSECSTTMSSASGFAQVGGTVNLTLPTLSNLIYLCTFPSANANSISPVPISAILAAVPPTIVKREDAVLRGGGFKATLTVEAINTGKPVYSLIPGEDRNFPYASYYTSFNRSIFLSTDKCGSLLSGTESATADTNGRVTLNAKNIDPSVTSVAMCANTPAGVALISTDITVSVMDPQIFVTGESTPVFVPSEPNKRFQLSSWKDCSNLDGPSFMTNTKGEGTASMIMNSEPVKVGRYTVCIFNNLQSPNTLSLSSVANPFALVEVIDHYDVNGTMLIVNVSSKIFLLGGVTSPSLYGNLWTDRTCENAWNYGTVQKVTSTTELIVTGMQPTSPDQPVYLCTKVPGSNAKVSFPQSGIRFAADTFQVEPQSQCDMISVSTCMNPFAGLDGGYLVVAEGDCCSPSPDIVSGNTTIVPYPNTPSSECDLHMDLKKVTAKNATLSVCMYISGYPNVCTTVGTMLLNSSCHPASDVAGSTKLSPVLLAAIIVLPILLLLLLLLLLYICCCRNKKVKQSHLHTMESREIGFHHMNLSLFDPYYIHSNRYSLCQPVSPTASNSNPLNYTNDNNMRNRPSLSASTSGNAYPCIVAPGSNSSVDSIFADDNFCYTSGNKNGASFILQQEESEGREQVALQEARARYNMKVYFNESMTFLRMREHQGSINVDTSHDAENIGDESGGFYPTSVRSLDVTSPCDDDEGNNDDNNPFGRALQTCGPSNSGKALNTYIDLYSFPVSPQVNDKLAPASILHPVIANSDEGLRDTSDIEADLDYPFASSPQVNNNSNDAKENSLSIIELTGYTNSQRFHDERKFLITEEKTLRRRIFNCEAEDRDQMRVTFALSSTQQEVPLISDNVAEEGFAAPNSRRFQGRRRRMSSTARRAQGSFIDVSLDAGEELKERDGETILTP